MRLPLAILGAALLAAACSSHPVTSPDDVALTNGFVARATVGIGPGAADGPAVETRVILTNRAPTTRSLTVGGCRVRVRMERAGTSTTVYDDRSFLCPAALVTITLAPGRSDTTRHVVDFVVLGAAGHSGTRLHAQAYFAGTSLDAGDVTIP